MGDQEEIQEQMKADMSALKEKMASMMDAMLGMRQLMENNVATAAAVSLAAEADPTLPATTHHPLPNMKHTGAHQQPPSGIKPRMAYPYGLPPNYMPPVMRDDAGHVPSPILEGEPPRQLDEIHEDCREHAQGDTNSYSPVPVEGPAPNRLPQPNLMGEPRNLPAQPIFLDLAAQVASPMVEREMITMMVDTLSVFYNGKLVGYMPSSFADMVFVGEIIEVGLKTGKFDYVSSTCTNARRIGATGAKRKEGDTHAITSAPAWIKPPRISHGTHQYAQHHPSFSARAGDFSNSAPVQTRAPVPIQREAPQALAPIPTHLAGNAHFGAGSNAIRNFPSRPTFTLIPMAYEDLLPSLVANQMAMISPGRIYQPPFPKWYNPEEEIPTEGRGHNRALHVSVKCIDHVVAKVLIDNGSSLNLEKLPFNASHLRPSSVVVHAFDDSRREIGPHTCQVTFQVMDINLAYNYLLGRPWIHSVGVVPSTLHQK
ncbi:hypothetical protein GmHk_06G017059 [Glycine max]|nr:hypothetical protein GmHk_06G017059 [Glycine max]